MFPNSFFLKGHFNSDFFLWSFVRCMPETDWKKSLPFHSPTTHTQRHTLQMSKQIGKSPYLSSPPSPTHTYFTNVYIYDFPERKYLSKAECEVFAKKIWVVTILRMTANEIIAGKGKKMLAHQHCFPFSRNMFCPSKDIFRHSIS